jgi:hypothetical protein
MFAISAIRIGLGVRPLEENLLALRRSARSRSLARGWLVARILGALDQTGQEEALDG